jgi:hypothetical protein
MISLQVVTLSALLTIEGQARAQASSPTDVLLKSFPKSVNVLNRGTVVEFCPDGTCDGFVGDGISTTTLRDIAYLYVYFFSDNLILDDWRKGRESSRAADRIVGKPEYKACRRDTTKESAVCVLGDFYRKKKFKAIFVRYDEGARSATFRDLTALFRE